MPPKKVKSGQDVAQSKAMAAKKAQQAADKTFGLKNKNKSKQVQKYIQNVTGSREESEGTKAAKRRAERAKRAEEEEYFNVYKPVVESKAKQEAAKKMEEEAKERQKKLDIYEDRRDKKEEEEEDIYKDQETLENAINTKNKKGKMPPTDIVCKHFIDAIEKRQYGYFWECVNGNDCHYRHCLPVGYVLKRDVVIDPDAPAEMTIEEKIEEERAMLATHTPLTFEVFLEWKEKKKREREEQEAEDLTKADKDRKAGKTVSLSGRALFTFDPSLFVDDDNAAGATFMATREEDEDEVPQGIQHTSLVEEEEEAGFVDVDSDDDEDASAPTTTLKPAFYSAGPSTSSSAAAAAALDGVDASLFNEEELPDDEELLETTAKLDGIDASLFNEDELPDDDELDGL